MDERPRYQDFVIKNGQLVGDFEGVYARFADPWLQSAPESRRKTLRRIVIDQCLRLRDLPPEGLSGVSRVLEVGCGFGYLTDELREAGFAAIGVDASLEAVRCARMKNPASIYLPRRFEDPTLFSDLDPDPDVVIMVDVTWYVLDYLKDFLERISIFASNRDRPTYLIHILETYAPNEQLYGRNFFTDLEGILQFFGLNYLEVGEIMEPSSDKPESRGTYFIAQVVSDDSPHERGHP